MDNEERPPLGCPTARLGPGQFEKLEVPMGLVLLIVLIVLLFGGGFGTTYGVWGGPAYYGYGYGGFGLGTILLIVLIILLLRRR
jgi:hypothetical protein